MSRTKITDVAPNLLYLGLVCFGVFDDRLEAC